MADLTYQCTTESSGGHSYIHASILFISKNLIHGENKFCRQLEIKGNMEVTAPHGIRNLQLMPQQPIYVWDSLYENLWLSL